MGPMQTVGVSGIPAWLLAPCVAEDEAELLLFILSHSWDVGMDHCGWCKDMLEATGGNVQSTG